MPTAHADHGLHNFPHDQVAWTLANCQVDCEVDPDYSHKVLAVTHQDVGVYDVLFDLNANRGPYNYQVTPVGDVDAYCKTSATFIWDERAGVRVRCYDTDGDPVDTQFSAFGQYHFNESVPPNQDGYLGYTASDLQHDDTDYSSNLDRDAGEGEIDAKYHPFSGRSAVYIMDHSGGQGAALITAKGDGPSRCFAESVKGSPKGTIIAVDCVDPSGQRSPTIFDVTYMQDLVPAYDNHHTGDPAYLQGAYVVLEHDERHEEHVEPNRQYKNVNGAPSTIGRNDEGTYTVALRGLDVEHATFQVTSLGESAARCRILDTPIFHESPVPEEPETITLEVICQDSDGDPLDAGFSLMYQTCNGLYD